MPAVPSHSYPTLMNPDGSWTDWGAKIFTDVEALLESVNVEVSRLLIHKIALAVLSAVPSHAQVDPCREALKNLIDDLEFRSKMKMREEDRGTVDCGHGVYVKAKEALAAVPSHSQVLTPAQLEELNVFAGDQLDDLEYRGAIAILDKIKEMLNL